MSSSLNPLAASMRRPTPEPTTRIGADIGGTFTDVAFVDGGGRLTVHKVVSTPPDFGRAVTDVVERLHRDGAIGSATEVIHGTTVATNAILERRGARTALITTAGFRDVLELRRARSPELYDARYVPPPPLVERRWRVEVTERVGPDGRIQVPINEAELRRVIAFLTSEGIESVAVCLLHSFRNPAHERFIGGLLEETARFTSLSVDLLPVIGEYERTSTTVVNAYIGPLVSRYLLELSADLDRIAAIRRLQVMQSSGGLMSAARAARQPAQIVESGPAGGVIAGVRLGEVSGLRDLICLDMGGTTAKASLIEDGTPTLTSEYEVGSGISLSSQLSKGRGYALKLPVLDIAEVGAGGGSIVTADPLGTILVGPHSAGAVPGPACYAAGGTRATVTDANVLLGFVNPEAIAGGTRTIHPDLAHRAIYDDVAAPLGLSAEDAAYGVYGVATATMARAVKAVTTYRGRDPRDFVLLAFGGNGPIFAAALAESLGMRHVHIPAAAGVFSALGLLEAEETWHFSRSIFEVSAGLNPDELCARYRELEADLLADLTEGGIRDAEIAWAADIRYAGQGYDLTVSVDRAGPPRNLVRRLRDAFHAMHAKTYGHAAESDEVELVNVRVIGRLPRSGTISRATVAVDRQSTSRSVWLGPNLGRRVAPVVARADLRVPLAGPALVEEYDTTTLVPPGWSASLNEQNTIVMEHLV
jgi:N-methylhydantoinase A